MINWIKDKYYWWKTNRVLKVFLSNWEGQKILLFGYPKSGNTWLRFLLFNYRTLLNQELSETISYNRLNSLQNNVMDRGTTFPPEDDYPLFYRTHKIYKKSYELFNYKIFIHRNPLDTLISGYYFYKNREIPFHDDPQHLRKKLHNIDFYVKYKIQSWINFYFISVTKADSIINYTSLKRDCFFEIKTLIEKLNWEINEDKIRRSIEFSSFKNVKIMAQKKGQKYGNAPKDGTFFGVFTRSGEEGQYKKELKKATINYVINKFSILKKLYNL